MQATRTTDPLLIYAAQVRAARALLNWSQGELAARAGVAKQTVYRIESGMIDARLSTVDALLSTLRMAGVEMGVDPAGVVSVSVPSDRL